MPGLVSAYLSHQCYLSSSDSLLAAKFDAILAKHGTNLARIRVWTSTNNAEYSLTYGLALAKRAVAAGMQLLIDLHYSDTCKPLLITLNSLFD